MLGLLTLDLLDFVALGLWDFLACGLFDFRTFGSGIWDFGIDGLWDFGSSVLMGWTLAFLDLVICGPFGSFGFSGLWGVELCDFVTCRL